MFQCYTAFQPQHQHSTSTILIRDTHMHITGTFPSPSSTHFDHAIFPAQLSPPSRYTYDGLSGWDPSCMCTFGTGRSHSLRTASLMTGHPCTPSTQLLCYHCITASRQQVVDPSKRRTLHSL